MNHLLDDVRKDAIRKSQGKKVTEQVYSAIIQLVKLTKLAYRDGLLLLDEEIKNKNLEPELGSITVLPIGIECIVDGTEDDILVEILTTKYWVKNPQGMEALAYYICIRGITMIRELIPVYYLESLLTALLPEECIADYEKRKKEKIPEQTSKSRMEVLLEKELDLSEKSIIIRNALEDKIDHASDFSISAAIQKLDKDDDGWCAFVLRGLSKSGKQKLLSYMSPIHRNAVLETEAYLGPVRIIDIENTMMKFLECIEETEKKTMTVPS